MSRALARLALALLALAALVALWLPRVALASSVWPLDGRHPHLLVVIAVVFAWVLAALGALVAAWTLVDWLWERADL